MSDFYGFSAKLNNGEQQSLAEYQDKVILVVNTASTCGFTKQYKGLQDLQARYAEQGFTILAFPCNQFGQQEPGDDQAIRLFCDVMFEISFPLFAKVEVNGEQAEPLFTWLKTEKGGWLGDKIKWNFTKFLIDKRGRVVERYAPTTQPERIADDIEALLQT